MTVLYTNNFDSETTGQAPAGWIGIFKVQNIGSSATSGVNGMAAYGEGNNGNGKYVGISPRTSVNYHYRQKAIFHNTELLLQSPLHGSDSGSAYSSYAYRVLLVATAASVTLNLTRCISTQWDLSPVATQTKSWSVSAGDVISVRMQVDSLDVKVWIWNESNESEPSTPTLSYTDSAQRPAGYFSLIYNNGGNTVATFFDDVTISDVSAGGASASFGVTSADATFSGSGEVRPMASFAVTSASATFSGSAYSGSAYSGQSEASISATAGASIFSGSAVGYVTQGVITTPALKNNTGTLLANETGVTVYVYTPATGALVVKKTGQTTNASGVLTVTDALIAASTLYRIVIVLGSGAEGMDKVTAS